MIDLARKYSEILTKGEIMELFKLLEEKGSLSEACRMAGIDRKTVYNWEKVMEMRKSTKEKVLRTALSLKPMEIAEFLADKTLEKATNIIARLLMHTYEKAMNASNKDEFQKYYKEFTRAQKKYDISIMELIRPETERLFRALKAKARGLNLALLEIYATTSQSSTEGIKLIDFNTSATSPPENVVVTAYE